MALFTKKAAPKPRPSTPRPVSVEEATSIVGPGMRITGDLDTIGTVRVDGRVEGTIRAGKAVVIGTDGEVIGDVITQDAVIGGIVHGMVIADSRLELQSSSVVEGEIRTRPEHLQIDQGARFNGRVAMPDETSPSPSAAPAQSTS